MNEERRPDEQQTIDRLCALLLTTPGNARNYSNCLSQAEWMFDEARRIGWVVRIEPPDLMELLARQAEGAKP